MITLVIPRKKFKCGNSPALTFNIYDKYDLFTHAMHKAAIFIQLFVIFKL